MKSNLKQYPEFLYVLNIFFVNLALVMLFTSFYIYVFILLMYVCILVCIFFLFRILVLVVVKG